MEHISGNSLVIKEININLVRKILRNMKQATKQQIAEITGLSTVTVGSVLQHLIKENEVFEADLASSKGGRPAQQFRYNENFSLALTLFPYETDGSIMIHAAVINLSGELVYKINESAHSITLEAFENIVQPLMIRYPSIQAIGFGLPSVENGGEIILSDYKALVGLSLATHFNAVYQVPIIVENDVNAAVMGFAQNQIPTEHTIVYLYFPDFHAPGAGIRINGKLYKGRGNFAGEVAAIPLGITWGQALYQDFDELCEAASKLIVTICCLLNPDYITFSGSYLTQAHISQITKLSSSQLPHSIVPETLLSSNFIDDYQHGMTKLTLELLEPDITLTKKFL